MGSKFLVTELEREQITSLYKNKEIINEQNGGGVLTLNEFRNMVRKLGFKESSLNTMEMTLGKWKYTIEYNNRQGIIKKNPLSPPEYTDQSGNKNGMGALPEKLVITFKIEDPSRSQKIEDPSRSQSEYSRITKYMGLPFGDPLMMSKTKDSGLPLQEQNLQPQQLSSPKGEHTKLWAYFFNKHYKMNLPLDGNWLNPLYNKTLGRYIQEKGLKLMTCQKGDEFCDDASAGEYYTNDVKLLTKYRSVDIIKFFFNL